MPILMTRYSKAYWAEIISPASLPVEPPRLLPPRRRWTRVFFIAARRKMTSFIKPRRRYSLSRAHFRVMMILHLVAALELPDLPTRHYFQIRNQSLLLVLVVMQTRIR